MPHAAKNIKPSAIKRSGVLLVDVPKTSIFEPVGTGEPEFKPILFRTVELLLPSSFFNDPDTLEVGVIVIDCDFVGLGVGVLVGVGVEVDVGAFVGVGVLVGVGVSEGIGVAVGKEIPTTTELLSASLAVYPPPPVYLLRRILYVPVPSY